MLMEDDISLVCGEMEDVYEDLLQRYRAKQEEMYEKFKKELKEMHQDINLVCAVPIAPSSS
jgi:polyhydroxyalkanoate synthesis regulator phasin